MIEALKTLGAVLDTGESAAIIVLAWIAIKHEFRLVALEAKAR